MIGVRYMTRLGYSPDALKFFFKKIGAHAELEAKTMKKVKVRHNVMSTHPLTTDCIEQAIRLANTKPVAIH
jgi:predicted Zn-dependent protease